MSVTLSGAERGTEFRGPTSHRYVLKDPIANWVANIWLAVVVELIDSWKSDHVKRSGRVSLAYTPRIEERRELDLGATLRQGGA